MKHHEFSHRSVLFGVLFMIAFVAAIFAELAAMLQYFNLVRGNSLAALQVGAITLAASMVPFLLMGLSISVDSRNK